MTDPSITPTRFATKRHGALAVEEAFRWALASHVLSGCVRHNSNPRQELASSSPWEAAAALLWPEARSLTSDEQLKSLLDVKIGRVELLRIRELVIDEIGWALEHIGPGSATYVDTSITGRTSGGVRVFGRLPFVLDDGGTWTLVSVDDGKRSKDLVRCWAWLADSLPNTPKISFIRMLNPATRRIDEWLWEPDDMSLIEHELDEAAKEST